MSRRVAAFYLAFFMLSAVLAAIAAEIGYRIILKAHVGEDPGAPTFTIYSSSIWQYDRDLGYTYKPNGRMDWAMIKSGLPERCGTFTTNSEGNAGRESSKLPGLDVAVLGDSFTAMVHEGMTWPDLLQEEIRRMNPALGVRVRNLSRDGYGVLQMVDQAAVLLRTSKTKPDVLVMAIIGPDLRRYRFWRVEKKGSGHPEMFFSLNPDLVERPETYARGALTNPKITRKWCEDLRAAKNAGDALLNEAIAQYRQAKIRDDMFTGKRVDPFSLSICYVCNKIRFKTPYRPAAGRLQSDGMALDLYSQDPEFMRNIAAIRATGVPLWLVYLPWEPELRAGEKVLNPRETSLLRDLTARVDRTYDLTPGSPLGEAAVPLTLLPIDAHPSMEGLRYYVDRIAPQILPALMDLERRKSARQ